MIVQQRIAQQLDVTEIGQEIKQRIAGSRNQDLVARIAEQAENERIRFAGSGCQYQIVCRQVKLLLLVIGTDRLAGAFDSARVRLITKRFRASNRELP